MFGIYKPTRTLKLWEIVINVKPQSKQSISGGGGNFFVPARKKLYGASLRGFCERNQPESPFKCPMKLEVFFGFPFNKNEKVENKRRGWYWKTVRPDLDNLEKPLDALVRAKIIADDSWIVKKESEKISTKDTEGYIHIVLKRLFY
tara:strand:+ start:1458 stop:1895 length:438 start_codon:yes stop_codon:yes gene_type:complete